MLKPKNDSERTMDPFRQSGSVSRSPPMHRMQRRLVNPSSTASLEHGEECLELLKKSEEKEDKNEEVFINSDSEETTLERMKAAGKPKGRERIITMDDGCEINKEKKKREDEENGVSTNEGINKIQKERQQLEEYLFNENNKRLKNGNRLTWRQSRKRSPMPEQCLMASRIKMAASEKKRRENISKIGEVILIKPKKEDKDKRTNDEIKTDLLKGLESIKGNLKIKNIKQMRNKGLILEVNGKEDVELVKQMNLDKKELKIGEPKRIDPLIIIYDVENDYEIEELKEDLVNKNFEQLTKEERQILKKEISFSFHYKTKENRRNWIIKMPGKPCQSLVNKGRVYMQWRTYRVKEHINITRCFKCQGYGHFAKFCSSTEQLCEGCGAKEHSKENCNRKDRPQCINCIKSRRKETQHPVKSKECPEYKKHVEIYKNKIKWS
ncbi:structural maintenance of chromosomes protein 2-like [Linepithema humile]|uniref:structural maintenance of chromosomes protein 2-like n=1 Tax=Linepithema humile TaxID=83485 RepID=UPI00351F6810